MTEMKLDISEGMITNAIAVAISEAFAPEKRDALLRDVIRAHLTTKKNSYDKHTLLDEEVGKVIRAVAQEMVVARIEELRPDIEKVVRSTLGKGFETSVIEGLKSSLKNCRITRVDVRAEIDHDED